MIVLSDKSAAVLLTAKPEKVGNGKVFYMIERTLGYRTWASGGSSGARADIAELYRNGLIREWFHPWAPPVYLTEAGLAEFRARGGE